MTTRSALLLPLLLALAACGGGGAANEQTNVDALDAELAESTGDNGADPLTTRALADQIMVDPQLTAKSNADAVRPPAQPYAAPVPSANVAPAPQVQEIDRAAPPPVKGKPCRECRVADQALTLGALAERQPDARLGGCAAGIAYGAGWANRLPGDVPLHPAARVIEAAGAGGGCALRIVSFVVPRSPDRVIDWYHAKLTAAGFSAERQADGVRQVLGGTRADDAYVLYVRARSDGGSAVDLIANNGR